MTEKQKNCPHQRWKFKKIAEGVVRKCTRCHWKILQVAQGVFGRETVAEAVQNKKRSRNAA